MFDDLNLFVESTITAITLDYTNRRMEVVVQSPWGRKGKKRIVVEGIADLLMRDVRRYNVIDRVIVFSAEDMMDSTSEGAQRLFLLMRGREPVELDTEWPLLNEALSRLRSEALVLMEVEPVYGTSILVLAKAICIESVTDSGECVAGPGLQ